MQLPTELSTRLVDYFARFENLLDYRYSEMMEKPVLSLSEGRKVIRRYCDELPGARLAVYRMIDAAGQVLYARAEAQAPQG